MFYPSLHAGVFNNPTMGIAAVQNTGKCAAEFTKQNPGENEITWEVASVPRGGACYELKHEL